MLDDYTDNTTQDNAGIDLDPNESEITMFLAIYAQTMREILGKEPQVGLLKNNGNDAAPTAGNTYVILCEKGSVSVEVQLHELEGEQGQSGIGIATNFTGLRRKPQIAENCQSISISFDGEAYSVVHETALAAVASTDFASSHAELTMHLASLYSRMG